MTGENCDMTDDSLRDYDDGGDNSTYLEVQPMDNSREGEFSSSEDSLQGYDDGGDNSTYLGVQPVDNSGECNSEHVWCVVGQSLLCGVWWGSQCCMV